MKNRGPVVLAWLLLACTSTFAAAAGRAEKAYVVASDQPAFAEAARAAMEALGGDAELLRADDTAKSLLSGAAVVVAVGPLADRVVSASGASGRVVECLTPKSTARGTLTIPLRPASAEVFG